MIHHLYTIKKKVKGMFGLSLREPRFIAKPWKAVFTDVHCSGGIKAGYSIMEEDVHNMNTKETIAIINHHRGEDDESFSMNAHANLIATAPELFFALEGLANQYRKQFGKSVDKSHPYFIAVNTLKKANGEQFERWETK